MSQLVQEGYFRLRRKQISVFVLMILLGMCASAVMYQITAQGPGVSPDSTVYIEVARNVLAGKGFLVGGEPMTHYPPVFPLLLAVIGLFTGNDILLAARLLSSILFGVNVVLVALAVYMCTRHDRLATGLMIPIVVLSAPVLSIHSMAWSESPYIAFSMTGCILLAQYLVRPNPKLLVLAALMAGFAAATRYIGITVFPVSVLALLVLSHKPFRHKLGEIILFLGIACLPLVLWLIRNMLVARFATNRQLEFHPFNIEHLKSLVIQMYDFVLPTSISGWTKAFHLGIFATLLVLAIRFLYQRADIKKIKSSIRVILPSVFVIYSVLYIAFLLLSISFFDAHTPVNDRLLLPVFFALIIVVTSVVKGFTEACHQKTVWYGYVLLLLLSVGINAVPAFQRAVAIHHEGTGYTAWCWKKSATLAVLAHMPENMKIYSNGPDVIRVHTQNRANMIPQKMFPETLKENDKYQETMIQMIGECEKGNALIVYFDRITWRWYLASKEEIESQCNIPLVNRMDDGIIYGRLPIMQIKAE
ncbi:MAG: hypothetical protein RBS57_17330 [Desulforhabdus sp.]|jgi:hypothetical protein|nr:hypothetical protein [Desulforhabdus sp.]